MAMMDRLGLRDGRSLLYDMLRGDSRFRVEEHERLLQTPGLSCGNLAWTEPLRLT